MVFQELDFICHYESCFLSAITYHYLPRISNYWNPRAGEIGSATTCKVRITVSANLSLSCHASDPAPHWCALEGSGTQCYGFDTCPYEGG